MVAGKRTIRVATRGSELALWQAHFVESALLSRHSDLDVEVQVVATTGDRVQDVPLAQIGDRGLFTKEVDDALLDGRADIAVHSLKDVPTSVAAGLAISAITKRADSRDVLLCRDGSVTRLADLEAGARIGTSSLRRRAQLLARRPDLNVCDLRGNLNTRLRKLDDGDYDAILLAAAGVLRLGWEDRITEFLDPPDWLPAVGQGALAILARSGDDAVDDLVAPLGDRQTALCVTAERSFLRSLEGGCQVPIAGLALEHDGMLQLEGLVADLDGRTVLRDRIAGPTDAAVELGRDLADRLVKRGADDVLAEVRASGAVLNIPAP
ncbi:MAG TPA: hydroxymethylbilane synthase [Longimicrobiaceae bacterium]|nr:hydroxymethylbilane synthase [Longimicrobiaceae bacterium]